MNLYKVELSQVIYVVAENERLAAKAAISNSADEVRNGNIDINSIDLVDDGHNFEAGWDEDCIPYGDDQKKKIKEYIK